VLKSKISKTAKLFSKIKIPIYLMGVHLTGVHLTGVHVIGVCLMGVHLMGVHLMVVHLMSMCLMGVYLINVHLTGVHLMGVCLTGVYLTGMYLMGMYLINVHLMGRVSHGHASYERAPHRRVPHVYLKKVLDSIKKLLLSFENLRKQDFGIPGWSATSQAQVKVIFKTIQKGASEKVGGLCNAAIPLDLEDRCFKRWDPLKQTFALAVYTAALFAILQAHPRPIAGDRAASSAGSRLLWAHRGRLVPGVCSVPVRSAVAQER
jgi:hypothetical protein